MIRFRRPPFHGRFEPTEPVWHILVPDCPLEARYLRAMCGRKGDNIFMDMKVSKAKAKPKGPHCKLCVKKWEAASADVPAVR